MNTSLRSMVVCRSAAINRELPDQLARRIAQAIGWGIVAYALIWLAVGWLIGQNVVQEFFGAPAGISTYCYFQFALTISFGILFLIGGIAAIKSPRLLFPVCVLITVLVALYSPWAFFRGLRYFADDGVPHFLGWAILCFQESIIGLFIVGALYPIRSRLELCQSVVPCQRCGYDLRGSKLDYSECGYHYAAIEFYKLRKTNIDALIRIVGFAMIGVGLAYLGSRIDFIIEGSRYVIIHSFDESAKFNEMVHYPSVQAAYAQIGAGGLLIICGLVTLRWPDKALYACGVSFVTACCFGWIEYAETMRDLGFCRISWVLGDLRPAIVGRPILATLFVVRRRLRLLRDQRPDCTACGCDLRHAEDLCCAECGRQYTPYEFYQL